MLFYITSYISRGRCILAREPSYLILLSLIVYLYILILSLIMRTKTLTIPLHHDTYVAPLSVMLPFVYFFIINVLQKY